MAGVERGSGPDHRGGEVIEGRVAVHVGVIRVDGGNADQLRQRQSGGTQRARRVHVRDVRPPLPDPASQPAHREQREPEITHPRVQRRHPATRPKQRAGAGHQALVAELLELVDEQPDRRRDAVHTVDGGIREVCDPDHVAASPALREGETKVPVAAALAVLVAGFGALCLFWTFGVHPADMPGLFDFASATWGDALALPAMTGFFAYAVRALPAARSDRPFALVSAVLAGALGAA